MLHTLSSATPTVALWQRSSIVRQKREQNPQFQAQCTRQAPQEHPTKQHRRELTLSVLALLCQASSWRDRVLRCTQSSASQSRLHKSNLLARMLCLCQQVSASQPAVGKPAIANKEVDDDSSALIQGLLAKSRENKDKYTKERLQDYYRRNYKVSHVCHHVRPP